MRYRSTGAPQSYDVLDEQGNVLGWVMVERYGNGKWQAGNSVAQAEGRTRALAVEAWQEAVKVAEELHRLATEFHELHERVGKTQHTRSGMTTAWHALVGAGENADLMAQEGGFEPYSARWYRSVLSAFEITLAQYDKEWGDPYTRNLEHDQVNKEGYFAVPRMEIGPRQGAYATDSAEASVLIRYRWINGKRFAFTRWHDKRKGVVRLTVRQINGGFRERLHLFTGRVAVPSPGHGWEYGHCAQPGCGGEIRLVEGVWVHGDNGKQAC